MNAKELRARLAEIAKRMHELANKDTLDEAGQTEFDALAVEAEDRQAALDRLEIARRATEAAANRQLGNSPVPYHGTQIEGARFDSPEDRRRHAGNGGPTGHRFKTSDGRELRSYRHGERIAQPDPEVSLGGCVHAILTGRYDRLNEAEQRAVQGGLDQSGGYLTNPTMSSMLVDLARAATVVERAGATVLPIDGDTIIATVTADATPMWRRELQTIVASQPTFGRLNLRPKTLAVLVPCSVEILEDAQNGPTVLEQVLQAAMAQALDEAAIKGSGSAAEPTGIVNTTGVAALSSVGTPDSFDEVVDAIGEVLGNNYPGEIESLTWVQHPAVATLMAKLASSGTGADGQPLQSPDWVTRLRKMYSSVMPLASSAYTSIVGDFSQVVIGMRTQGIRLEVLPAGTATDAAGKSVNAATDLARLIRLYLRADIGILRPGWLCTMPGVTLSG